MDFFVLGLSDFFDLVVVDVDLFALDGGLVKSSFSFWSFFWGLEANEGIDSFFFFLE